MRRLHGAMFKLPLMITCEALEDFILAYLEDDLPRKQRLVFEMHLKVCRECRDYLRAYRAAMDLAKQGLEAESQVLPEEVPQDLIDAVVAARDA
ncbi:MAG: zf-HC2 domain-containing protein [Alphaproteobacteria bacterium]|nr:zf-HC2 domain-containing protein [Alphaproteobacteria bacterium]MDP6565302.1 zf-HC2 domain-containing protein [Alphaproteobacteria bacterium]